MLRARHSVTTSLKVPMRNGNIRNCNILKRNSSNINTPGQKQSGGSQTSAIVAGTTLTAVVGGVVLAKYNESFRKTLEYNVPFSKTVFDTVIGPTAIKVEDKSHSYSIDMPASKLKIANDVPILPTPLVSPPPKTESPLDSEQLSSNNTKTANSEGENTLEDKLKIDENISQNTIKEPDIETVIQDNSNNSDKLQEKVDFSTQQESQKSENISEPFPKDNISEEINTNIPILQNQEKKAFEDAVTQDQSSSSTVESDTNVEYFPSNTERSPDEVQMSLFELEKDVLADTAASKSIIEEELSNCANKCIESIANTKEAHEAISLHTKLVQAAMDSTNASSGKEKSQQWEDVTHVLEQKTRLESMASASYANAREGILKLRHILEQAKKHQKENLEEVIIHAEENLNKMTQELEEVAHKVDVLKTESRVMLQYQELAEHAKEQFRKELLSVMPDVNIKPGWRGLSNKLSQDDLNALIAHAHRRIDQLQRELAEERSLSSKRVEEAVSASRTLIENTARDDANLMIEQQKRIMENELLKKLNEARQMYENEMRLQLKRQAAAHSEHLADVLALRDQQLEVQYNEKLAKSLDEQRLALEAAMLGQKEVYEQQLSDQMDEYQLNLNKAFAKISGIDFAIEGRAHIENESRKAQELWLACEALRVALKYGKNGQPVPLKSELTAITNIYEEGSGLAAVAATFPTQSQDRGVFTEESIRKSFNRVSKLCRRLSMVNEQRNSLFTYILSYLKSFLIVNTAQEEPPEKVEDGQLNDTFKILSYARFCMENGNLEQATRFMNQLTGEPKRIAEGWLKEARLYLETQQAVTSLLAMASSINIACNIEE